MNFQLGVFVGSEVVVDLRGVGLLATLANSPTSDAILRVPKEHPKKQQAPVSVGEHTRTYNLTPVVPGEKTDEIYVWSWIAHYYWTIPNSGLSIRQCEITLARLGKKDFKIEFSTWQTQPVQFVPDTNLARALEESFQTTRI